MTRLHRLVAGATAFLLTAAPLAACSGDDAASTATTTGSTDTAATLTAIADEVIVPAYDDLVADLDALATDVESLCTTPSAGELETARADWKELEDSWQRTRAAAIGPAMERRLGSSLGFFARADAIDELLAGTGPVDEPALRTAGATVKGVTALELALFGPGAEQLATAEGARRCEYAASVASIALADAEEVRADWTAYRETLAAADPQELLTMLVNQMSHRLTELDDQRLRSLVEAESLDELADKRIDGPAAHRMAELEALLAGVALVIGTDDGDETLRLDDLVHAQSPAAADDLATALTDATESMAALPDDVTSAFADPVALAEAQEAVAALKVLVATQVASQLGVTISFSDADGDS